MNETRTALNSPAILRLWTDRGLAEWFQFIVPASFDKDFITIRTSDQSLMVINRYDGSMSTGATPEFRVKFPSLASTYDNTGRCERASARQF
jgi:hypothetical protein